MLLKVPEGSENESFFLFESFVLSSSQELRSACCSMFAEIRIMIYGETTIFNSAMELRQGEGLKLSLVSWEGTILD